MRADGEESDRAAELNQHQRSQLRDTNKHMLLAQTYIDHIRHIMDVILRHHCIRRCQVQQIVIPRLGAFQLIFRILGLPLEKEKTQKQMKKGGKKTHISAVKWSSSGGVFKSVDHETGTGENSWKV